jgi:hypothetical protein
MKDNMICSDFILNATVTRFCGSKIPAIYTCQWIYQSSLYFDCTPHFGDETAECVFMAI